MCLPWWMLMQEGRSIPVRQVPRGRWLCGLGNGDIDDLDDHDDHDDHEVQVEVLECWGGWTFNPDMSLAINYINWLMNRLTNIYLNLFKSIKNNQSWDVLSILYEADHQKTLLFFPARNRHSFHRFIPLLELLLRSPAGWYTLCCSSSTHYVWVKFLIIQHVGHVKSICLSRSSLISFPCLIDEIHWFYSWRNPEFASKLCECSVPCRVPGRVPWKKRWKRKKRKSRKKR